MTPPAETPWLAAAIAAAAAGIALQLRAARRSRRLDAGDLFRDTLLYEIYAWTRYKNTPWARRVAGALGLRVPAAEIGPTRMIACPAIRYRESGRTFCGVHHGACVSAAMAAGMSGSSREFEAGFLDNEQTFLTRSEAWKVADAAGQILRPTGHEQDYSRARRPGVGDEGMLFSENLYRW